MLPTLGLTKPVALVDGVTTGGTVAGGWLTISNLGSGQHAIWLSATNSLFTNNPPVACGITIGALTGIPATVQIVGGANPPVSDPGGNPLTVSGVTAPAHGLVTTDGTNIFYTATNNYLGSDSFIYTVSDPQGAAASALVTVNVFGSESNYNLILTSPASPNVVLAYAGIPGNQYVLEQTYDLTPPVQWLPLLTNMAGTNGLLMFTNHAALATNVFWRMHAQ